MSKTLEFFFDVGSPASYLAWTQLPRLAAETGATIVWKPMLLGGVFKATGNASPVMVPAKGRWMWDDLARCAARFGVPLRMNPAFPINTLTLMRGAIGTLRRSPGDLERYLASVLPGIWAESQNLGDPAVLLSRLAGAGFDPADLQALVADADVKAALIANTDEAVQRGVFGAPTMFVGGEMHFGQDRLDFVREALARG